ncbi:MAG: glycine betaine ABC transporter substrate-binding protein [Streptosporangiales bacterium]
MRTRRMRRAVAAVAVAGAMSLAMGACGGGTSNNSGGGGGGGSSASKTVTIGYIPWDEDLAATEVWKQILEKKGYTVDTKQLDAGPLFNGVATGDLDMFFDVWLPTIHANYWKKYGDKVHDDGIWFHPADVGLAVPDYVKLQSLSDLKGKASMFDGKITGIEASAGEMHALKSKVVPKYGLKQAGYTVVPSSTPAMLAALQKAIGAHKPIVVTLWRPHWAFKKYKIHYLKDPKNAWGKPDKLHTITSKQFASSNKKVTGWLQNFKMTPDQLQSLEAAREAAGKGKEAQAKATTKWMDQNKDVWKAWLK